MLAAVVSTAAPLNLTVAPGKARVRRTGPGRGEPPAHRPAHRLKEVDVTGPADQHPSPTDRTTPAAATDGAPAKQHGDPLLAASEGRTEGTEGSRHGADASQQAREHREHRD